MTAESLAPYLAFFTNHLYTIAFIAALIDATGVPFPGRLLIITAGALAADGRDTTRVVLLAAAGAVVGDHILYLLGRVGGDRVLSAYCRWTMGSSRCIEKARAYFRRFGALAIVIGRFTTGVRLFAATLAGSGGIRYVSFLLADTVGALLWAGIFVVVGHLLGARAGGALKPYTNVVVAIGIVLALVPAALIAYRLWRRRRHGPAASPRLSQPRPRTVVGVGGGGGN
jgi:membrane protein DedA with SNARE-associated domain